MSAAATEAQRRAYEASHIENPTTGQSVHIAAAIAHLQKIAKDATPGAGRTRYVTGERQPIISEDGEGTGFACEAYYELHMTEAGLPLATAAPRSYLMECSRSGTPVCSSSAS